jgi:hypothetical protein
MSQQRRRAIMLILAVSGLVGVLLLGKSRQLGTHDAFTIRNVNEIVIEVDARRHDNGKRDEKRHVATLDRDEIAKLLAQIRNATEGTDHKCSSLGQIVLRNGDGKTLRLDFLPGHDEAFYEFRLNQKLYRVQRAEFLEATKSVGIELPLTCN